VVNKKSRFYFCAGCLFISIRAFAIQDMYIETVKTGKILCWPDESKSCNLSGIVLQEHDDLEKNGYNGFVVNETRHRDKELASIFSVHVSPDYEISLPNNIDNLPEPTPIELEAVALTTDHEDPLVMVTTAFSTYNKDNLDSRSANIVLAWPLDPTQGGIHTLDLENSASIHGQLSEQFALRKFLLKAISDYTKSDVRYFRIEGLTCLPGKRILFGVSEYGVQPEKKNRSILIIEAKYKLVEADFRYEIDSGVAPTVIYDLQEASRIIGQQVGLTSLDYNIYDNRLYFLTGYDRKPDEKNMPRDSADTISTPVNGVVENKKNNNKFGSFLWSLGFKKNGVVDPESLSLAKSGDSRVNGFKGTVEFPHNATGLAFLDKDRFLIIYGDGDKQLQIDSLNQRNRPKKNEAMYSILKLVNISPHRFPDNKDNNSEGRIWENYGYRQKDEKTDGDIEQDGKQLTSKKNSKK